MQAGAAHDAVHQERGARHVAEVFQQQDEEEQDDDLRQEHDDAADAGDHAVLQEALQQAGGQGGVHEFAERVEAVDEQSISGCAQANTAWNITNRISAAGSPARHRMQHHGVDPRGPGVGPGRQADAVAR